MKTLMSMELSTFLTFPVFFCLLLFIYMAMKLRNNLKYPNPKLPPGPWKLPVIGNLHQIVGALPHHKLRYLSNIHGPLMHLQLGQVSAIVISSPEMASEVMKKHDLSFASRPRGHVSDIFLYDASDIVFSPYGASWRQLRKICTLELVSIRRVKSFRNLREEEVSDFIKSISLSVGKPVNLTEKLLALSSSIISKAAFGKKSGEEDLFLSLLQEGSRMAAGFAVVDLFPSFRFLGVITGMTRKLEDMHRKSDKIINNIINEHKLKAKLTNKTGGEEVVDDLVDVLLKCKDGANMEIPLTADSIKAVIMDIFIAGSEPSAVTVEWAMAEMIKKPSVMAKAQAEVRQVFDTKGKVEETDFDKLSYLKLVIKETLRLHPALPFLLPRECRERCEINGYEIPLKTKVIINAWAIGRDPNYWTDPDAFNPQRFEDCPMDYNGSSFDFIPFGAGRRICPGISFGLANVELHLAALLFHFDWKVPDGINREEFDLTEKFSIAVGKLQPLVLIPVAHHKSSIVCSTQK